MKRFQMVRLLTLGWALLATLGVGHEGAAFQWPFVRVSEADFALRNPAKETLGKFLFFDKVLSGNRNISCATCHHPLSATGDGLSLPVGEGGSGLGVTRDTGLGASAVHERVPRNSPALFNLGANEFVTMFHDGRVMVDIASPSGFSTPAKNDLPPGLDSALAAQAMFPVTSGTEMAGQVGENTISAAAAVGLPEVWRVLAARLGEIPEYVQLFAAAYPEVHGPSDITYVQAANAIAAYEAAAFQCIDAPYDRYARGNFLAVSNEALIGSQLFYGKAGCASCHAGPFQTDHQFHAIGVPQIGPGKGHNLPGYADGQDDFGREGVTGKGADRFKFRTPSLRQVAVTGPWGHDGAFNSLEAMVRHHLDAAASLERYDPNQAVLPQRADLDAIDFATHNDPQRRHAIAAAIELPPVSLSDQEVDQLMAFLYALTDFSCLDLRAAIPARLPSGLPLGD